MKTKILSLVTIAGMLTIASCGQTSTKTEGEQDHNTEMKDSKMSENMEMDSAANTFKVYGNCGHCKARIETAAKSVEGVTAAEWNQETKMLEVSLEDDTDIHKVHAAIAAAGHDTEMHKADDEVYNSLPACCQYR